MQKRRVPHIAAAQVQEPADAVGLGEEGRILPGLGQIARHGLQLRPGAREPA
jgi:hypothetical protein